MDKLIKYGIELELGIALDDIESLISDFNNEKLTEGEWIVDEDYSLEFGSEIISPILCSKKEYLKDIKMLCEKLKENNIKPTYECGFHIHYNADYFEKGNNNWTDFIRMWMVYEPIIYRLGYGEKTIERPGIIEYAAPLEFEMQYFYEFVKYFSKQNLNMMEAGDVYSDWYLEKCCNSVKFLDNCLVKERGLNLSNVFYCKEDISQEQIDEKNSKPTIEIRNPDGTSNYKSIKSMIFFFGRMLEKSKKGLVDRELMDYTLERHLSNEEKITSFNNYKNVNIPLAEELFSFLGDNNKEENMFMRQYLKTKKNGIVK